MEPLVVIPMAGWNRISEKALRFGLLLSKEIKVVHVHSEMNSTESTKIGKTRYWLPSARVAFRIPNW